MSEQKRRRRTDRKAVESQTESKKKEGPPTAKNLLSAAPYAFAKARESGNVEPDVFEIEEESGAQSEADGVDGGEDPNP